MADAAGAPGRTLTCPILIGRAGPRKAVCQFVAGEGASDRPALLVVGEAGLGKSRLVAEARAHAVSLASFVLEGACFPGDSGSPYAPLLDMLRARVRDEAPGAVSALVEPFAQVLYPLVPDLVPRPAASPTPDAEYDRGRLFAALAHGLTAGLADRPILLIVEDLHWCDDGTLNLLLYLLRQAGTRGSNGARSEVVAPPFRLLGTYRAEDADPRLRHWLAQLDRQRLVDELSLSPLGRADVAAMIAAIVGEARGPVLGLVDAIYELSEGTPFWVEELLNASIASGELCPADDGWDWRPRSPGQWHLPRTLHDAVYQRVVGLSPRARELVTLAAVIGRRFDVSLLQTLAGIDDWTLLGALRELVQATLVIEESHEQFSFRHALTRRAIYAELLHRERIAYHRSVLAAAEQLYDSADDRHLDELAYHAYEAEAWDTALDYACRAGQRALRLYAPRAAERHLTHAIEAARRQGVRPPAALISLRGRAYETLGDTEAASRDFETALEEARAAGDRLAEWQALVDLGETWASRSYAMSGEYYRRALDVARDGLAGEPRLLARTLNFLGNWHTNLEQTAEAIEAHEAALATFRQLDDPVGIAETLDVLGMASYLGGDLPRARTYCQEAVERLRALDDRRRLCSVLASFAGLGTGGHLQDLMVLPDVDLDGSIRAAEAAVALARDIAWRAGEAYALNCLAICCTIRGAYRRATEAAQTALTVAEAIEHREWIVHSLCSLVQLYLDVLAIEAARPHAERAVLLARDIGSRYWIRFTTALASRARALDGDLDGATALLAGHADGAHPARTCAERTVRWARAALALDQGEPALALEIVDELTRSATNARPDRPIRRLALLRGEALLALGRDAEAEDSLRAARHLAAERCARPLIWRADVSLGRALGRQGRRQQASEAFAAARALVMELAAEVADPTMREQFVARASTLLPAPREPSPRRAAREAFDGLTAREREVAALIGLGKSNREIADALVLGERTVQTHVSNIFAKLGVSTRAQVAVWAASRGLVTSSDR